MTLLVLLLGLSALHDASTGVELARAVEEMRAEAELDEPTREIVAVEVRSKLVEPLATDDIQEFLLSSAELVTFLEAAGDVLPTHQREAFATTLSRRADLVLVERVRLADTPAQLIDASRRLTEFMSFAENQLSEDDASAFGFAVFVEARAKLVAPIKSAEPGPELRSAASDLVAFMVALDDAMTPPVRATFHDVLVEAGLRTQSRRERRRFAQILKPVLSKKERRALRKGST